MESSNASELNKVSFKQIVIQDHTYQHTSLNDATKRAHQLKGLKKAGADEDDIPAIDEQDLKDVSKF